MPQFEIDPKAPNRPFFHNSVGKIIDKKYKEENTSNRLAISPPKTIRPNKNKETHPSAGGIIRPSVGGADAAAERFRKAERHAKKDKLKMLSDKLMSRK